MRIAIVGLGGVGGYLAAYLSESSHEIVGFTRGEHLKSIQKNAITIKEDDKTFEKKIDARELDKADGYFDIVLFCVKSYDLKEAYKNISGHIDSMSILLSFSNGVNNADILRNISDSVVLDACIYILSHIEQNGVIRKNSNIFSAVFGGNDNAAGILKEIFESVNLRVKIPSDIKTALYKKYIFISAFASLTTYFDESIAQVYESHFIEAKTVLQEIAKVAATQGVDISAEVQKSLDIAKSLPYTSSTSMHLDYKHSKKMEIESLCGFVVKLGEKNNIDTPFMKKIYQKLVH